MPDVILRVLEQAYRDLYLRNPGQVCIVITVACEAHAEVEVYLTVVQL